MRDRKPSFKRMRIDPIRVGIAVRLTQAHPRATTVPIDEFDARGLECAANGQIMRRCQRSLAVSVITKGDKILDVVPEQESLVIEAQIPVDEISEVYPNIPADVHLTAYKARITPVVRGTTTLVSADRLTDKRGDNPYSYYTALVTVDQSDLEALPNVRLYPGMPATVMFPTVKRTAFNYEKQPRHFSRNARLNDITSGPIT
jgi:HlyD family secretion protein